MGLRDIEATLPPGFRFAPSDEELVCHYLYEKIADKKPSNSKDAMVEVNLHLCEPWQLPDVAKVGANEWYFFSFRDRKYSTGFRSNRSTTSGYWKATGKDRAVLDPRTGVVVGMRKTLVFYNGRAPNGVKSGWVMHEFRLENAHMPPKEDWVLCRVFNKCKEDLTTSVVMHNGFNPTLLVSSPTFSSSSPVTPANMPCGFQQRTPFVQIQNYEDKDPRILLDVSAFQNPPNTMHSGHPDCHGACAPMGEIQSSGDGILLDLVFDDKVIEDAESLDFDELVF